MGGFSNSSGGNTSSRFRFLVFLALAYLVYFGVQFTAQREKQRKALDEFNETRRDMAAQMQREIEKDGGVSADTSTKVAEKMRQQLEKVAEAGGDKKAIAVSELMTDLQSGTAPYIALQKRIETEAPFNISTVKDKADLAGRRKLGQELLRVNSDYLALIDSMESRLREKLQQLGAPNVEGFVAGFMKTFNESAVIQRRLRQTDDTWAKSLIAIAELLEAHWGKWKILSEIPVFDDDELTTRYKDFLNAAEKAAEDQAIAARELIQLQQRQ